PRFLCGTALEGPRCPKCFRNKSSIGSLCSSGLPCSSGGVPKPGPRGTCGTCRDACIVEILTTSGWSFFANITKSGALDVGTLLKVLEKLSALLLEQPAVTATKSKVIKGILILCIISSPSKKNHLRAFILASASIVSTKLRASELPWSVDL